MTGEAASVGEVAGPTTEPSGRRLGDLVGVLALHVPLALLILIIWGIFTSESGLTDTPALVYLAGGAIVWLALAAVLVRLWATGRANLWEVPLAWLLLGWLTLFVLPLMFWPRCRRWLIRSSLPWIASAPTERDSAARVALQIAAVPILSVVIVLGPLFAMLASGVAGEHTYTWEDASFSYPSAFRETKAAETNAPAEEIEAVFLSYRGSDNGILFQALTMDFPEEYAREGDIPDADMEELAEAWGGGLVHEHIAELPALSTTTPASDRSYSGAKVWKTRTAIFDLEAGLVYVVSCQYEDQHRLRVEDGCEQVLSTFEVNR